jgi:branched-chain amino acid transport system substrate-binding protein
MGRVLDPRRLTRRQLLRVVVAAAPLGLAACAQATPVGAPTSPPTGQAKSPVTTAPTSPPTAAGSAAGPIKIGYISSFTGLYSAESAAQFQGAQYAVDEVNAQGGVLGRQVTLVQRDDQLRPDEATRRTQELVESERVDFIVGSLSAATQLAINSVTRQAGMVFVSLSQSDKITAQPDFSKYTFHEALTPRQTSTVVARWALQNHGRRPYFLVADYAYGHEHLDGWRRQIQAAGGTEAGMDLHPLGAPDFSGYFPKILAARPDFLVLANFGKDTLKSAQQAVAFGIKQQMPVVISLTSTETIQEGGADVFGDMYMGGSWFWTLADRIPASRTFVDGYQAKFNRPPSDYGGYAYSGTLELLEAVKRAGATEPDKVVAAMEGHEYDHYKGKQFWRRCDHQSIQDVFVYRIKTPFEGEWNILEVIAQEGGEGIAATCAEQGHAG